jgi:hypothetical protein
LKEVIKLPFGHGGGVKGNVHLVFDSRITECEALNARAWVFQEAVLARRLLIYSRTGVAWSCISDHIQSSRFEPHKMTFLVEQIAVAWGLFGHPDHREHLDPRNGLVHMNPLEAWYGLVEKYSSMDLTCFHDRLPALAGIAREFQSIINDRYIAGMWARDLAHQLTWSRKYHSADLCTTEYRAPSWSWAVVTGGVHFDHWRKRYEQPRGVKVLACHAEPLYEQAPFGQVKSGFLEVEAFLCSLKDLPPSWLKFAEMDRLPSETRMDVDSNPSNGDIPCMILGCGHERAEGFSLEPMGNGTYRRIGIFIIRIPWNWPESLQIRNMPKVASRATKQRLIIV